MPSRPGRFTRALVFVAAGSAGAVLLTALPAASAPALVSGLSATLAAHGLQLSWSNPASGTPIVRDVTSESGPYDPAGPAVLATAPGCPATTCRYDGSFTNTSSRRYAVWSTEDGSAGTASSAPEVITVDPMPVVATSAALAASVTSVVYNRPVVLTGTLTRAGLPLQGAGVKVVSAVLGAAPSVLASLTTGVEGTVRLSYVPKRARTYRLVFDGDAFSGPSASPVRTVAWAPRLPVTFSPGVVEWKQTATFKGVVEPWFPGATAVVQRLTSTGWTTVARPTLSSSSRFAVPVRLPIGRYAYRALFPKATSRSTGVSATAYVRVTPRTLVQGDYGPDVLAAEKRLAALRYDVGRVDSSFTYDTRHGVTAFQKVEGLARTGRWSAVERARAAKPRGFRMRFRDDRLTAEVDITRQVLVLGRNGVIQTIVDVSTGSEQPYYQDGVRYIARTPRGVFSINRKIDGIRVSKLGELYRPSYFYKGWAVHGSGSVPTYPASHGCVRITNPVADRLFQRLAIGTRVAVYDE
ncbi:MAG TPA: L,D-transpeptidase family protein [Mycobacteriales bacterium]|nr:L,D-transpeptidase family protein [Mycobacteriales bacterium]